MAKGIVFLIAVALLACYVAARTLPACKVGKGLYPVNELFVTNDCKLMCICQAGADAACSPLCPRKVQMNCTANQGIFIRYEVRSFKPKCYCERETCIQRHIT